MKLQKIKLREMSKNTKNKNMEWEYSGGIHSGGSSIYHNASGRKKGSGRV